MGILLLPHYLQGLHHDQFAYMLLALLVLYKIMGQTVSGRNKMAGSVVVACLLLLIPSSCRSGLPQDEKYTTRSDLASRGCMNTIPNVMCPFCVAVMNFTSGCKHRRSLRSKRSLRGDNSSPCLCQSVCNLVQY